MSFELRLPQVYGDKIFEFLLAWHEALGDRGKLYRHDKRLYAIAQRHAEFLAARTGDALTQSMHIGAGGSTPNERVRAGGYRLPDWVRLVGNSVESCASNWEGPTEALERLLASPYHRAHLLGEGDFANHVVFGIANARDYWVILCCPPE